MTLARVELIELELDHALRVDSHGLAGSLGEPFVQWLEGRLILAVIHKPLSTLGV